MKRKKFEWTGRLILIIFSLILVLSLIFFITKQTHKNTTEQLLTEYMNYINKHEYEKMYKMISKEHSSNISMEEFVKRNKNIYEGLETKDLSIKILNEKSNGKEISYLTSFNTLAGEVKFQNEVNFIKEKFEYKLVWKDSIIFPQLESTDKVRIDTVEAERGQILDRNGKVLAGKGVASSVGLVPGKIQDKENTIIKLAELLEVDIDVIKNKLSAEWVKDDSFVPIKTIPKVSELELMKINPDENLVKLKENQEELLSIPGVMINDIEVRDYPLKEAASHLVGYIQKVTAEDLEENKGKGYNYSQEGVEYYIPKQDFEEVIQTFLTVESEVLESNAIYNAETKTYLYRPRGLYDYGSTYEPYPEVVSYEKMDDGKIKLIINAVWERTMQDNAMTSELVIQPLDNNRFHYISNQVIKSNLDDTSKWYRNRLTYGEWNKIYKENDEIK